MPVAQPPGKRDALRLIATLRALLDVGRMQLCELPKDLLDVLVLQSRAVLDGVHGRAEHW